MNLMMCADPGKVPIPAICKPKQLWTGKQVFSLILPKAQEKRSTLSFTNATSSAPPNLKNQDDSLVLVEHGELLAGHLCKKTLGAVSGMK
jgi:DNA-directed RNA polymerase II subunit RPB1